MHSMFVAISKSIAKVAEKKKKKQLASKCRTVRVKLQKLITELDEADAEQAGACFQSRILPSLMPNRRAAGSKRPDQRRAESL